MIGYGMAKAATHFLVESLAQSGLPEGSRALGVLPITIDTPGNRAGMPDADTSTWTPTAEIAGRVLAWVSAVRADAATAAAPASGSLVVPVTTAGTTQWKRVVGPTFREPRLEDA
jgi:dihydropteridine reductase